MDKITIKSPFTKIVPQVTDDLKDIESISFDVNNLSQVSDGYHTIAELYDHRITLYIALCRIISICKVITTEDLEHLKSIRPWRSKTHSDGKPAYEGWFIMGIGKEPGKQTSYHIPLARWDETDFAETLDKAPEWDGHTSDDVLNRLKSL